MDPHIPQSPGQVVQVSVPLQERSPQNAPPPVQGPQSSEHVLQVSPPLQVKSPQTGAQVPQSPGHVEQVSVPLQVKSPHTDAPVKDPVVLVVHRGAPAPL